MPLSRNQIKHLRSLAHNLSPVVMIGQHGLTENVMTELESALLHHELVKIKIASDDRLERQQLATTLATDTGAETVQVIGKMLVLFKRNPNKPKVQLPAK